MITISFFSVRNPGRNAESSSEAAALQDGRPGGGAFFFTMFYRIIPI